MSESRPQGIGVTIKYGKEYDKTWVTFQGSAPQIREDIVAYFEIDAEGLTLHELVINATQQAHGVTTAVSHLRGAVIPAGTAPKGNDEAQTGGDAWSQAEAQTVQPDSPYISLLARIESFTQKSQVPDLKKIYAENTDLFTADTDEAKAAKKAWQSKGKALQKAA